MNAATEVAIAILNGQAVNGDGFEWIDVKHATLRVAVHGQMFRAGAAYGDIFVHVQLAASQRDCLPFERRIEIDRVAVVCVNQRLAQRAWAAIIGIDDGDRRRRCSACAKQGCAG